LKIKAPIRALKGFERNFIKAGESKIIRFEISPEDLSLIQADGSLKEVPGKITITAGGSQPNEQTRATGKTIGKEANIL